MNHIRKVLVASTSTTTCKKAIHYGVTLAKQLGAELYVYHSDYSLFHLEGWGLSVPSLKALRESYREATLVEDRAVLDNIIEQEKTPDMRIKIVVNDKPMEKEVPRIVAEEGIDLLIMMAFKEGRLEHLLFSSSTDAIIRKMPCSMILVKDEIKQILVVSTSTATCERAIHNGVIMAKNLGAKLYVYHSDYDPFDIEGWGLPIPSFKELRESFLKMMRRDRVQLDGIVEREKTPDMSVEIFVSDQPMVKEVPRIVHEKKIDLLIMTAFEEGRLEHFFFNTSMHEIIRTMPCSIMLVKVRHSWET